MKFILSLLFCLPILVHAEEFEWKVSRVIDGDTLVVEQSFLPKELELHIRVLGIDTPEKGFRAKCKEESSLGEQATIITKEMIDVATKNNEKIIFKNIKWDKFGGRLDADVYIGNRKLSDELIKLGVARPYFGERKQSWCNGE